MEEHQFVWITPVERHLELDSCVTWSEEAQALWKSILEKYEKNLPNNQNQCSNSYYKDIYQRRFLSDGKVLLRESCTLRTPTKTSLKNSYSNIEQQSSKSFGFHAPVEYNKIDIPYDRFDNNSKNLKLFIPKTNQSLKKIEVEHHECDNIPVTYMPLAKTTCSGISPERYLPANINIDIANTNSMSNIYSFDNTTSLALTGGASLNQTNVIDRSSETSRCCPAIICDPTLYNEKCLNNEDVDLVESGCSNPLSLSDSETDFIKGAGNATNVNLLSDDIDFDDSCKINSDIDNSSQDAAYFDITTGFLRDLYKEKSLQSLISLEKNVNSISGHGDLQRVSNGNVFDTAETCLELDGPRITDNSQQITHYLCSPADAIDVTHCDKTSSIIPHTEQKFSGQSTDIIPDRKLVNIQSKDNLSDLILPITTLTTGDPCIKSIVRISPDTPTLCKMSPAGIRQKANIFSDVNRARIAVSRDHQTQCLKVNTDDDETIIGNGDSTHEPRLENSTKHGCLRLSQKFQVPYKRHMKQVPPKEKPKKAKPSDSIRRDADASNNKIQRGGVVNYIEQIDRLGVSQLTHIHTDLMSCGEVILTLQDSHSKCLNSFASPLEMKHIFRELLRHLMSSEVRKVCYGAKSIVTEVLKCMAIPPSEVVNWRLVDVKVAAWLLDPDHTPPSFPRLVSEDGTVDKTVTADLSTFLRNVSVVAHDLESALERRGMLSLYHDVEMTLLPTLSMMELSSFQIDVALLLKISKILKVKLDRLEKAAHTAAGHGFCLSSHHQLRQVLFAELRLDRSQEDDADKLTGSGVKSTSETVLKQLQSVHPLPGIILEHRQLQKLKSTYIDGILSRVSDGYLSTHWDQTAAATGRLTSYQPNMQAIPKTPVTLSDRDGNEDGDEKIREIFAREAFISREGHSFVSADYQQIELRILAHLTNDQCLVQSFTDRDSGDIFVNLTSSWLSKPRENVAESEREQTKRVVYSIIYGAGKEKLSEYLNIKPDQAKVLMESFLGHTSTVRGRQRKFPDINHTSPVIRARSQRQAVNFCVQGFSY